MDIYGCEFSSDELRHYGIKGMKWGVRRFQDKTGRLTSAGKKRYSEDKQNTDQKKKGLTDKQKRAIKIGAVVAGTALLAIGAYKLGQSGKLDSLINAGKQAVDNYQGLENGAPVTKVIKNLNPTKSNTNCRACSIGAVLRQKGYDVEALDISGGSLSKAVNDCFTGAKHTEMYNPSKDKIVNIISKKYTDGDYGVIGSGFNIRGSRMQHAYNWLVEDGKVRFFDGQKEIDDFSEYLNFIDPSNSTDIFGLTNAIPNLDGMLSYVRRRG